MSAKLTSISLTEEGPRRVCDPCAGRKYSIGEHCNIVAGLTTAIEEVLEHVEGVCMVLLSALVRFKTFFTMAVVYLAFLVQVRMAEKRPYRRAAYRSVRQNLVCCEEMSRCQSSSGWVIVCTHRMQFLRTSPLRLLLCSCLDDTLRVSSQSVALCLQTAHALFAQPLVRSSNVLLRR